LVLKEKRTASQRKGTFYYIFQQMIYLILKLNVMLNFKTLRILSFKNQFALDFLSFTEVNH